MKTKNVIGSLCVLGMLAFAFCSMPGLITKNNTNANKKSSAEREEKESYNDAAKYLLSLRMNPATGKVDPADVAAANREVDAMMAASKANRMKSAFQFNWEELGPDNVGGRTRAILFDRSNPNKMFAGGVSGGLWRSTNHGQSWYKLNDSLQNLNVSCITQAANGDIYFGTGNGFDDYNANPFPGDGSSGFAGQGVWKSTDDGATFSRLSSTVSWVIINNIYADATSSSRIYAAMDHGLRMSDDGGATWINPVHLNLIGGSVTSVGLTVKVSSDGSVLCCVGGQLYLSDSIGHKGDDKTFKKITTVPAETRIEVAIAPSNPNVMYAAAISGGSLYNVYRTTDKFQTVTVIGPGGGSFDPFTEPSSQQGFYDCAIAVAPDNQDKIFVVGVTAWKWTLNTSWVQMNGYTAATYIHPDMHTVIFNPNNAQDFFIGTDGGLFESQDQGLTFAAMNRNYNVTQFYSVSAGYVQGTHDFIGGTQDNGCLYIDGLGNTNQAAHSIHGGDGFQTATSFYNPNAFFVESQFGGMGRSSNRGTSAEDFYDSNIDSLLGTGNDPVGVSGSFSPFNTCFHLWENMLPNAPMDTSFFIGIQGGIWMTKAALDFSKGPKWYKIASTQFAATCMDVANDGKTLFAGTGDGKVWRISHLDYVNNNIDTSGTNYNLTVGTAITKQQLTGLPTSQAVTSISVDPTNKNHVIVTFGNYGTGLKHVLQSHNAMNTATNPTWTDITHNLPATPAYSSMIDKWDSTKLLLGTDLGLFTSNDGGATWNYQDEFPRVATYMIKQISQYTNGAPAEDIYVGTHGRGLWRSTTLTGIHTNPSVKNQVNIYPNPTQEVANISYSTAKADHVMLEIYNIQGRKIKTEDLGIQSSGSHIYAMNVSGIATGTYFMNVIIGDEKSATKFVIAR